MPSILLLVLLGGAPTVLPDAASVDCARVLDEGRARWLAQDYATFDQTEGEGFRALAGRGCPREAARLIEAWLATHADAPRSVTWHLAQMRAEAGENEAAIAAAREVLREEADPPADGFHWNDHVLAFIAFLQRDRAAFDRHADRIEGAAADPRNAMNARFQARLRAGFDRTYREAVAAGGD